jgi:hypothetical protein
MKRKQQVDILDPVLGPVTYPAVVFAAFLYIWCAGEFIPAILESVVGTLGVAWGWAGIERKKRSKRPR